MKELYNPIVSSLEEIKCWDDKDTSSGADVLLTAICQSEYIVSLVSAEKLLSYTLILCQKLQSSDADLWAALNYADYVLQSLKSLREKVDEFSVLFQEAQKMVELNGTTIKRLLGLIIGNNAKIALCNGAAMTQLETAGLEVSMPVQPGRPQRSWISMARRPWKNRALQEVGRILSN
ncbi:hypothetical protein JTE90_020775 [Oedothorax gibbosus]|uniref:Uncharacterized protein n=1 Tax=Oedothorax gibbosus TaxID=931172 RepID=A0AAV6TRX6_9ARAC|nr:hypothetical protein JTE90_020775 [Oedothorax gibbosus]